MTAVLVLPSTKHKDSYLEAIQEFSARHLQEFEYKNIDVMKGNFSKYVEKLRGCSDGIGLPAGYVAHTEYWLVDGEKYIGRLDLRHKLNDHLREVGGNIGYDIRPSEREKGYGTQILKLGLEKAKELGLKKVLLTCTDGNTPSEKIIVKNGGVYEDKKFHEGHRVFKKRFWINLQRLRLPIH
jgi:predicted acetyltransferase